MAEPAERATGPSHSSEPTGLAPAAQQQEQAIRDAPRRLYVGMLPFDTVDAELSDIFATFGTLEYSKIMTEKDTGRSVRSYLLAALILIVGSSPCVMTRLAFWLITLQFSTRLTARLRLRHLYGPGRGRGGAQLLGRAGL